MPTIVYDAGALLAAERRNPDFLALHDEYRRADPPDRPGRGPGPGLAWGAAASDVPGTQSHCDIIADDQPIGRAAGVACAASATADVVDAIVIATAIRHQAPIVTSDPGDLAHIADSIGIKIRLYPPDQHQLNARPSAGKHAHHRNVTHSEHHHGIDVAR